MYDILFEGMTSNRGGKEAYIMNLFSAFDKTKYRFSFLVYDETIAYEQEIKDSGARIIRIPPRHKGLVEYRRNLYKVFSSNHFDVLWANKTSLSSCEILEIAQKKNVPVRIVHSHCSSNMGGKLTFVLHCINKVLVRRWANVFFACSDKAAAYFFGRRNVTLMKNGVNVDCFRFRPEVREQIRNQLGLENNFVIGHVGRFSIEKNHKKLISVFHELKKIKEDAKLVLCGDGPERAAIETQIKELKLRDSVILLGAINNVNEVLQAMDIIVMPSLFEGLPFSLLEAQTSGLNCVVSDTVSRESDILGGNVYLPLSLSDDVWAQRIAEMDSIHGDRTKGAEIMTEKGFSMTDCVKQAEEIIEAKLLH